MGLEAACDFHTLPLPLEGGSHGAPDDAVSQTKAFALFLYHFLRGRVHLLPTCGCPPAPGSEQEICPEQHVRAAKTGTAGPHRHQQTELLVLGRSSGTWCSPPETRALSHCTVALLGDRGGTALGLLSHWHRLQDHFGVATSITSN